MENNVIKSKFKEFRPKREQYTPEDINQKISRETKLAIHSLRLFCIKNIFWLLPLILFIICAFLIDVFVILFCWKNPTILFMQLKIVFSLIVSYILGLYTDYIRKKLLNIKNSKKINPLTRVGGFIT